MTKKKKSKGGRGGKTLVFDVEADGLLREATVIHCISVYSVEEDILRHYGPLELSSALSELSKATCLIGLNICGYDFPLLRKLHSWYVSGGCEIIDLMLVDQLLFPEEFSHSLENIGKRIGAKVAKVEHENWSKYSPEMQERCDSDVLLTKEIWEYLRDQKGYDDILGSALEREQEFLWLHTHQALRGFKLDLLGAVKLYRGLDAEVISLEKEISSGVPPKIRIEGMSIKGSEELQGMAKGPDGFLPEEHLKLGTPCFKKNGDYTVNTLKYFEEDPNGLPIGPYSKLKIVPFNINSPAQVQEYLLEECGWVPTVWNKKQLPDRSWVNSTPKLTEDSFSSIKGGVGPLIARYNIVKHRRGILLTKRKKDGKLSGFLADAWERGDGRVSADGITCGTNTSRVRHRVISTTVAR